MDLSDLYIFFGALIFNGVVAIPLINSLYKQKFYKIKASKNVDTSKRNPSFYNHLFNTMDTPSSFGVLIILNLILYQVFFGSVETLIITTALILFGIMGLFDDYIKYFKYEKIKRWGLTTWQKLILQIVTTTLFLYLSVLSANPILIPIIILYLVFITNSVNIVDGLDGLLGTILMYIIPTLAYFEIATHNDKNLIELSIILFSFLFIFLYFNIKPARVFLGDVGSMPLGFFIAVMGLRYNAVVVLVLFSLIIIDGLSSVIQILAIRFLKRRVFIIAPLHLHLLNKKWEDTKIVQRAGIIQLVLSFIAIFLFKVL